MNKINELKEICIKNNIPIIRDDVVLFFDDFFKKESVKNFLEIGTAYGYSSLVIHSINPEIKITTIEKNKDNINIAMEFISDFANLINIDVRDFKTNEIYDVIFFDGPKTCQIEMFENLNKNLSKDGTIIIDNIFLRDLSMKSNSKRIEKIINKNNMFIEYLNNLKNWDLKILDIGDGIGVLKRCKN